MVKSKGAVAPFLRIEIMKWIIVIMTSILFIFTSASAQEWVESYDPNTEITIKGTIAEVIQRKHGPLIIGILKEDTIYNVVTAPGWYIEQERMEFKLGDKVIVHGSKFFSRKGELFLIARSINNISKGKNYSFRDEYMQPCWRGGKQHGKKYWKFIPQ